MRFRALRVLLIILCLFLACTALSGCSSVPGLTTTSASIRINEVVSSNAYSLQHELLGSPDWIELYNPSSTAINLKDCGISDNVREPSKFVFPDTVIQPGGYLIVYASSYDGELPDGVLCTGFGLSKNGEQLIITDKYMSILDQLELPALDSDVSYAYHESGAFGYCASPTPGKANTTDIVSKKEDIRYGTGEGVLVLSEAVPDNQSGLLSNDGKRYAWAELCNTADVAIQLRDYWLSDSPDDFYKYQLPDVSIAAGGREIVFFSGLKDTAGEVHATFKLGSEDAALYLSDRNGVVSELTWVMPILSDVAVLQADGAEKYTAYPTPGAADDARRFAGMELTPMDESDPVRLNEVLRRNRYSITDADGERSEWVELYNQSPAEVSLEGYYLSDREDRPTKWAFPNITLGAGEYLTVFLSGKNRTDGELHASFGLSGQDDGIFLVNMNGLRTDGVTIPDDIPQNVSIGKDENGEWKYFGYPTPGAENDTAGFDAMDAVPQKNPNGVYISEVSSVSAAKSGKRDWIELYNPLDHDVKLDGWYVSNDADDLLKHKIEGLTVKAKGYALIYASDRTSLQKEGTAAFNISSGGDTLLLSNARGIVQDIFEAGALRVSVSSGRDVGDPAGRRVFYTTATPGEANTGAVYAGYVRAPAFSRTALYNAEPFALTITCATENARIYYTTDGAKPTSASTPYTGPITISANTPVRAVAILDGLLESEITTHTFLFEAQHTVPVIAINAAQADIDAVYAATTKNERVEREMHFEYFEAAGKLGVASPCGLRASGASTLTYAQKSFTVYFRGGYGRSSVAYPFFEDYAVNEFASLVIRNGGQDSRKARLRDSFFSLAVEGMYIENVATRPVVVYLNGEYWGIYDLNENQNEDFMASHYGVDRDAVDIISRNIRALAGSNRENKRVREYGRTKDFSSDAVYEQYCEWVDMDYLIDYVIAQTYFANGDMFNQKYWRSQDYTVKWRPVLFDLDYAFSSSSPSRNMLNQYFLYDGVPSQDGSITNMDLFCGLPKNAAWRERFVARYVYVVTNYLSAERLTAMLDEHAAALRPEMERHIKRWRYPSSVGSWENEVKELRACLDQRPEYALRFVQKYFDVSDAKMEEYKAAALAG